MSDLVGTADHSSCRCSGRAESDFVISWRCKCSGAAGAMIYEAIL